MKSWASTFIIVAGILCAAVIVSRFFLSFRVEKDIEVKGYGELVVRSDTGKFSVSVSTKAATISQAQANLTEAIEKLKAYIHVNEPKNLTLNKSLPDISSVKKMNDKGISTNEVEFYAASQTLSLDSPDVEGLSKMIAGMDVLFAQGLELQFYGPQYFINDTEQYKQQLIKKATESGRQRAEILASAAGGKLGRLTSAKQGVIQINAPNSTQNMDDGSYDTSTIEKVLKVPVTLNFQIVR
jgi:hypothetical protein